MGNKRLSNLEVQKVYNFLSKHEEKIKTLRIGSVADFVSSETEIKIYSHNVRNYLKELNIPYDKKNANGEGRKRSSRPSTKNSLRIKTLAIAIRELYEDCGAKQHPGVIAIIESFK